MALTLLFYEFKDNGKINNGIIIYQRKENDFIYTAWKRHGL